MTYRDEDQLPDGVYLGLSEERYFQQRALGSSDLADLWLFKEGWWWKSKWNPWHQPEKTTDAKRFGSACHTLLLEGADVFAGRYHVEPDPRNYPELLVSVDDLVSALMAADAPGVNPRARKKDLVDLAKVYFPGRHIWDDIVARSDRKAGRKLKVTAQEKWELDVMLAAALEDADMRAVVTADGGVRLTEVSVFWTLADGTRLRFRFDSLLPTLNADLKTLGNARGSLTDAVGKRIGEGALDVQAAISFEARRAMYRHILEGRVFINPAAEGDMLEQKAWLDRFPDEAPLDLGDKPGWSWCWMFFQKPELTGVAPTIFPAWMRFGSLEHRDGYRKAVWALAFYKEMVAKFGLDKPWTKVAPMHHLDAGAKVDPARQIKIPHWYEQPMAVPDEQEVLSWRKG